MLDVSGPDLGYDADTYPSTPEFGVTSWKGGAMADIDELKATFEQALAAINLLGRFLRRVSRLAERGEVGAFTPQGRDRMREERVPDIPEVLTRVGTLVSLGA
jgi:hypothetical protein